MSVQFQKVLHSYRNLGLQNQVVVFRNKIRHLESKKKVRSRFRKKPRPRISSQRTKIQREIPDPRLLPQKRETADSETDNSRDKLQTWGLSVR